MPTTETTLQPGTPLYLVGFDGKLRTVQFVRMMFDPIIATQLSILVRDAGDAGNGLVRASLEHYRLTKEEAWQDYIDNLLTAIESAKKDVADKQEKIRCQERRLLYGCCRRGRLLDPNRKRVDK